MLKGHVRAHVVNKMNDGCGITIIYAQGRTCRERMCMHIAKAGVAAVTLYASICYANKVTD